MLHKAPGNLYLSNTPELITNCHFNNQSVASSHLGWFYLLKLLVAFRMRKQIERQTHRWYISVLLLTMLVTSLTLIQNDTVHRKNITHTKISTKLNKQLTSTTCSNYGEIPLVNLSISIQNDQSKHKKNSRAWFTEPHFYLTQEFTHSKP